MIWNEVVVFYLEVLYQYLPGDTGKNYVTPQNIWYPLQILT
jgi:hypothetical protein